jgi:hypothetical protein
VLTWLYTILETKHGGSRLVVHLSQLCLFVWVFSFAQVQAYSVQQTKRNILTIAESPRWYIKKGRLRDAWNSLKKLRNYEIQAARDLYYMYSQIQLEESVIGMSLTPRSYFIRFTELFTKPRVRRATLASFVVMIAQQMCGS